MRIRIDRTRGTLAVYRRRDDITMAVHIYNVLRDGRRKTIGRHQNADDLDGVFVEFSRRSEYANGAAVSVRHDEQDVVTEHLIDAGVTVVDAIDDDADAEILK
jgi:hypothetical protein